MDGTIFRLWKFRTMRPPTSSRESDETRVSRVGRVLRASSLDELPTLWNVVRGDMALVGPRPLLPEYTSLYNERQRVRLRVHPGLTGLVQVKGRNRLTWAEKFELDQWYVLHRSCWLDVKILFQTPLALLRFADTAHSGFSTMPVFTNSGDLQPQMDEHRSPP